MKDPSLSIGRVIGMLASAMIFAMIVTILGGRGSYGMIAVFTVGFVLGFLFNAASTLPNDTKPDGDGDK